MKTTIDIADDLILQVKAVQKRDDVTLRALVEDGLRMVLERHARTAKFTYKPVVFGTPGKPGKPMPDINRSIGESNVREWVRREFGADAVREDPAPADKSRKPAAGRRRRR